MQRTPRERRRLLRALEELRVHDHLTLIYETRSEQFDAVIPFIRLGLDRGEKCLYIVDETTGGNCGSGPCLPFNPFTETPVEGVHWRKDDDFGEPTAEYHYQIPREYRFSIGFRF